MRSPSSPIFNSLGIDLNPVPVITYGVERLAMHIQRR